MSYRDFNPTCSVCGAIMSQGDISNPDDAPVCDECEGENENPLNDDDLGDKKLGGKNDIILDKATKRP